MDTGTGLTQYIDGYQVRSSHRTVQNNLLFISQPSRQARVPLTCL